MDAVSRIERCLHAAVATAEAPACPPGLAEAMAHAVFPRGARIRPRLLLAVAAACEEDDEELTDSAGAAIELLHCASLVHDDLPCFDDADTRRGRASVHRAFGAPRAVLAGDALIVLAFQTLAAGAARRPGRLPGLVAIIAGAVGVPGGIVAGQAWECEAAADIATYHDEKTAALFAAATMAGAAAAGREPGPWRNFGTRLGAAYQIADDVRDAVCAAEEIGKPVGRDADLARPSAVRQYGVAGALARLQSMANAAAEAVPDCKGAEILRALVRSEQLRLTPKNLSRVA